MMFLQLNMMGMTYEMIDVFKLFITLIQDFSHASAAVLNVITQ